MKSLARRFADKMNAINQDMIKAGYPLYKVESQIDKLKNEFELDRFFWPSCAQFVDGSQAIWDSNKKLWLAHHELPKGAGKVTDEAVNDIAKTVLDFPGVTDVFVIEEKHNKLELGVVCNHVDYFSFLASEFEKPGALPAGMMLTVRRFVDPDHWFMYSHPKSQKERGLNL